MGAADEQARSLRSFTTRAISDSRRAAMRASATISTMLLKISKADERLMMIEGAH